jgi:Protein of unknown function (DUF2721)
MSRDHRIVRPAAQSGGPHSGRPRCRAGGRTAWFSLVRREELARSAMLGMQDTGSALDTVAHVIQVALTPIFLLTGIATLLNVFSTRLARVADRVDALAKAIGDADPAQAEIQAAQLAALHRRSVALDVAVVLAALGGAATCGAVLALFLAKLTDASSSAAMLFALFGLAVVCALGAIIAFTTEMLMAGTGIRTEVALTRRSAAKAETPPAEEPRTPPDGNRR